MQPDKFLGKKFPDENFSNEVKKLIVTITLNTAIDKTMLCPSFEVGSINRANEIVASAGGKGLNVARTVKKLGGEPLALCFSGGLNGEFIEAELERERIAARFVKIKGNTRVCLAIIEKDRTITEIHEPSPNITEDEWKKMKEHVRALSTTTRIFTLNGSVPGGMPGTVFKELILLIRQANPQCKVYLDSSGDALKEAILATPYMIKPNKEEMEQLLGKPLKGMDDYISAINVFLQRDIQLVVLSLGAEGVIFGTAGHCYMAEPINCQVVNTVGCGDALLGGIASRLVYKSDIMEAMKYGVAAATANLLTKSAGDVERKKVEELVSQVKIKQLI